RNHRAARGRQGHAALAGGAVCRFGSQRRADQRLSRTALRPGRGNRARNRDLSSIAVRRRTSGGPLLFSETGDPVRFLENRQLLRLLAPLADNRRTRLPCVDLWLLGGNPAFV